ncbi:hypothetical protein AVEN_124221-1 [Araneus ventricosus]|uniref:Uncharacterized protein n=1 Tax=Araneus ventricosus TaxID=182803 RepID=A0A4Y1ZQC5_ARAVE|nr:hypothetical protein AVEN_124221-1 [Araneus ventricosus]
MGWHTNCTIARGIAVMMTQQTKRCREVMLLLGHKIYSSAVIISVNGIRGMILLFPLLIMFGLKNDKISVMSYLLVWKSKEEEEEEAEAGVRSFDTILASRSLRH